MAFEFFFGVFGLISTDSSSRHKSRLDGDWRLFTPLGANLFDGTKKAGSQSSTGSPGSFKSYPTGASNAPVPGSTDQRPIFSTTGTLGTANNSVGDGVFSSASSYSATSIGSSVSTSTVSSTASLIKAQPKDIFDTIIGAKNNLIEKAAGIDSSAANAPASDDSGVKLQSDSDAQVGGGSRARSIYCAMVCVCLWLQVLRVLAGLVVEKSIFTLDFYYLGSSRIHFLIPALCMAIQAAAASLIFIRNNDETNWLVPFYSSKDYLILSRSNFRPKMEDYTERVKVSVAMALSLAMISSLSLSAYLMHCVMKAETMQTIGDGNLSLERLMLIWVLFYDILWAIYATYICFLVAFYFNLICSIMKSRFHGIAAIIEDLTESNTTKTTNQARKITTLYLEHNEACELLDESNDFWQYLIFFTYFTYIPAYCYCLYNLFFVEFDAWPSFITWVIHTHTGFIILLISFSAAGVSTEAHAPYTSLHTLSLIQLPLDVEVNIATFLHRVRGLTIGYSCYDLFAITNGSMSNTAAACASYFLIVADFNRSSVFTMAAMNGTSSTSSSAVSATSSALPTG